MNSVDCDNLDAFLADDLAAAEASHFTAHLTVCACCREALDQQRWIDGLLRSPLAAEIEAPRAAFVTRVESRVVRRPRSMRLIACGFATAAMVVVAAGWTVMLSRQAVVPGNAKTASVVLDSHESQQSRTGNVDASTAPEPRATFVGGPEVLVVPIESRHSNVTVVRVYPVYEPDHMAQADAELPASADEFVWPFEFNGG
jgi:hypothetical protein